jgi:ketosteroid isomerase-like protein
LGNGERLLAGVPLRAMDTAAMDLSVIKQSMAKTNELFSSEVFGKRNFTALDQIYTKDARILPPGRPMASGRPDIKGFWFDMIRSFNAKSAVLETVDVMPVGEGLVEIGKALLTAEPAGQPEVQFDVKYVVLWKQEDGQWKWHVDIWNMNL